MERLRIAFMGSPDLGVPCLRAIADAPDMDLLLAVTAPDKRRGRGGDLVPTPVGQAALDLEIPLLRWDKGMAVVVREQLEAIAPDVIVVIAFSRLLRPRLLRVPRLGCLNLHASLLPWGRGASPIQQAILEGLGESGWSAMHMDEGLDTGPVLGKLPLPIDPDWNSGDLYAALKNAAPEFLLSTIRRWAVDEIQAIPQSEEGVTHCAKISADAGAIDWEQPAERIERMMRAYQPWPGVWCKRDGKRLGLIAAQATLREEPARPGERLASGPDEGALRIACGEGALTIQELKPQGKRSMNTRDYLNGQPLPIGALLEQG